MQSTRTIKPRAEIFARHLRGRYVMPAAGSNLAQMIVARHSGHGRCVTDFPTLIYQRVTGLWNDAKERVGRGITLRPPAMPIESMLSNAAGTLAYISSSSSESSISSPAGGASTYIPGAVTRAGKMIQRRTVPGAPASGFSTGGVEVAFEAPVLRRAAPFQESFVQGPSSSQYRVFALASPDRKGASLQPGTREVRSLVSPSVPVLSRRRFVALASQFSGVPNSTASIGAAAEIRERFSPSIQFPRSAPGVENEASRSRPEETASSRAASDRPYNFAEVMLSKAPDNEPGVHRVGKNSVTRKFTIFSVKPFRARGDRLKTSAGFQPAILKLVRAPTPKGFNSEIFRRDIRVSLGHESSLPLEQQGPAPILEPRSATFLWGPSLDLTLQLSNPPVAAAPSVTPALAPYISNPTGRSLAPESETSVRPMISGMGRAAEPQVLSMPEVVDKVYRLLERRLMIERERRGIFR